jgi:hypothetical protein
MRPSLEQCLSGIEGHDEDTRIYQRTFDQQSGQIVYTSSNTTYEVLAYVAKLRLILFSQTRAWHDRGVFQNVQRSKYSNTKTCTAIFVKGQR